jgi:hypothetical protein
MNGTIRIKGVEYLLPAVSDGWLAARCEEDGDCLIWQRSLTKAGVPQASFPLDPIQPGERIYRALNVRRLLYQIHHRGNAIKGLVTAKCKTPGCVNPKHLIRVSHGELQTGRPASLAKRVKLSQRSCKHPQEVIDEIRNSDEPSRVLDRRLGLSIGYAARVRRGVLRSLDYSSPFAGLMAGLLR